ncbi:ATP synthase F1 subcomplex gamma subunit [Ekhidna lutea]|uniref:ATP synthase gamma chain n=1 Tax=Ekhidna lutea TaxID=447679 RepID=A0A239FB97_EKHLU|nr:ATP synthase F1 subunit gamma [Ekhidna lutea]SNS54196.1 ATP synthase F1 subcomplex gamma subunit [Ekhidna lutea]
MANLKEVKGRIQSVVSTQQITKAMKMVAAAKLRRAQDRIIQMRPYSQKLSEIIQNVSGGQTDVSDNPYSEERSIERVLLVVVSSDRGLCGAFNSSVFKGTKALIAERYSHVEAAGNLEILPIGKKAFEHFSKRKYNVIDTYSHLIEKLNFADVKEAAEMVMAAFLDGTYDQVDIIYNEFKNVATQIVKKEQFLPIKEVELDDSGADFGEIDYIYEPSKDFIFDELVPKSLKIQFYKTLLESNASEHGARMTAMDKATENADDLLKELRLTYNRTRQAAITKEILEIVGGAEALAQG